MERLDLGGEWTLTDCKRKKRYAAEAPGCVHADLLANEAIPDPFYRDNEKDLQWIGTTAWAYERTFEVDPALLERQRVLLCCDGLDTLATLWLNGTKLGATDNMFRRYEFDAKKLLKPGRNTIRIHFDSAIDYIDKRAKERSMYAWNSAAGVAYENAAWIRKQPCNFGWDWGPKLVTCGIWKPIALVAFDTARLAEPTVTQHHGRGAVKLKVDLRAEKAGRSAAGLRAAVTVRQGGRVVAEAETALKGVAGAVTLPIVKPKLWWPHGLGAQPLYEVTIELLDKEGELLDSTVKRIGLRTLELVRKKDTFGQSFRFECNGVPFFAKGANWIPNKPWPSEVTHEEYRCQLESMTAAHMNMIRVWGGGIYESDDFYDLCDELGICVWQDFIFSCSTYPAYDKDFMASVKIEAEENIARLRHHASLALWCGNNELEQGLVGPKWDEKHMSWKDYKALFDKLLPALVKKLDPHTPYWPCSPHSPVGDRYDFNSATSGDNHCWHVWFSEADFETYRDKPSRFNSEFGFQAFPEPKTVHGYTKPEERNITHPIMEHHQRSGPGNKRIASTMYAWFRAPKDFDATLWLSQIQQGLAIKIGVEHWRRSMPQCMGTLYWQLNDMWPVASWASIDGHGRWKALHYMAARFFAPVLLSAVEDPAARTVDLFVTSDEVKARPTMLRWRLTDLDGKELDAGSKKVRVQGLKTAKVTTLRLAKAMGERAPAEVLLWTDLRAGRTVLSSQCVMLDRPRRMHLSEPSIKTVIKAKGGGYEVTLTAKKPALWSWLELSTDDALYSDRFVHLEPRMPATIEVIPHRKLSATAFKQQLKVQSLLDTFGP